MAAVGAVTRRERVAVFGGDGRLPAELVVDGDVDVFRSAKDGGNGDHRRLLARLRRGSYDRVIILRRWNGHPQTKRIVRTCKRVGIAFEVWSGVTCERGAAPEPSLGVTTAGTARPSRTPRS